MIRQVKQYYSKSILVYIPAIKTIINNVQAYIPVIVLAVFFFITNSHVILVNDESLYHYPNLLNFYNNGLSGTFSKSYSAANTPLPYIMTSFFAKFTTTNIIAARILTLIISFLALLNVKKILDSYNISPKAYLIYLFMPYFFANSFGFYAVNYGIFFLTTGLLYLRNNPSMTSLKYFYLGIIFTLAILCQQFYLLVPFAVILAQYAIAFSSGPPLAVFKKARMHINALLMMVPLILPFYIFYQWGGLTHEKFRAHAIAFSPSTVIAILFISGMYFSPLLIQMKQFIKKSHVIVALMVSVILVLLFRPVFHDKFGEGLFTGLTFHMISALKKISVLMPIIAMIILCTGGLLVFKLILQNLSSPFEIMVFTICAFLIVTYSFNTTIGERHLLGLNTLLLLIVLPKLNFPLIKYYLFAMASLGITYYTYWTFFKYHPI